MKREGHFYLLIGLVVAALVFFQFNPVMAPSGKLVSEVKKIDEFKQLLVNVKCNIYFVEGENQGIVYEGPQRLVKNIKINVDKECITISKAKSGLTGILIGWIDTSLSKPLNVYIVVRDIKSIEMADSPKMILSENLKNNRIIFPFNSDYDEVDL